MKTITKTTFALFTLTLGMIGCSKKNDNNNLPKIAKEITADELLGYQIIEEYQPKPEYAATFGDKPLLMITQVQRNITTNKFLVRSDSHSSNDITSPANITSYNAETGITTLETVFGGYELTRDENEQMIVKNSYHPASSNFHVSKYFASKHIQIMRVTNEIFHISTYKALSGSGYYRFNETKWRYKTDTPPTSNELIWNYNRSTNTSWYGSDGGSAQLVNRFTIIPRGNGWKGQHKDKDLLLVNVLSNSVYKSVGDIGVYTVNN